MATMEVTRLKPLPGRYPELRAVISQTVEYAAQTFGNDVLVRAQDWRVAEENAVGQVSIHLVFPDSETRARMLDRWRVGVDPLSAALESSSPPALVRKRVWCDSVDAEDGIPAPRPITSYAVFELTRGRESEAMSALAEAQERHRQLGAAPMLWVMRYAAEGLGLYIRELGFDSYEELTAYDVRYRAAPPSETPMAYAERMGLLRRIAWVLAVGIAN